jgi:hypothetical protein
MADRTLVQDQLKMLYSIVQVSDRFACHVCGKSFMTHIRVSSNLTFNDGLQQVCRQQRPTRQAGVTHVKQDIILIVTIMQNSGLQREGRVITVNGREGDIYGM